MKTTTTFIVMISVVAALAANGCADQGNATIRDNQDDHPFFAVWNDRSGLETGFGHYQGPYLRFAFWDDGRVVFAKESEWKDKPLQRGKISADRVDRLKHALRDSGVLKLRGTCYLVPDGGSITMSVELGEHKQTLYWDEVKVEGYGINFNPQPQHREFIRCWEALNSLGLAARPKQSETVLERVRPQPSWSFRPAIQSE